MSRQKLKRFSEIESFHNVIRGFEGVAPDWHRLFFGNENPLTLEVGCGKGEYTVGLARRFPERNFIGIDKKGERIWCGAVAAMDEKLPNALFLQCDLMSLPDFFEAGTVSEIWIPFPDPFPKKSMAGKRLTSPKFLDIFKRISRPNGIIHLKTDDSTLFEYSIKAVSQKKLTLLDQIDDLHAEPDNRHPQAITTTFERRHLESGKTIKYLCCLLSAD